MNKSFSYSQSGSTFRLINQSIKIHLAQRTNLFKKCSDLFTTSVIDIFFNSIRAVFPREECGPEEGMENLDCFMPLLMVVRVLVRVETLISNGTLRRHLEV